MAEYIDRRKAAEVVCKLICGGDRGLCVSTPENCQQEKMLEFYKIPVEDVAPVVHGEWEWFDEKIGTPIDGYDRDWGWRCSVCKDVLCDEYDDPYEKPKMKYCSACGAKMNGGE